jgi:hypothetical protein
MDSPCLGFALSRVALARIGVTIVSPLIRLNRSTKYFNFLARYPLVRMMPKLPLVARRGWTRPWRGMPSANDSDRPAAAGEVIARLASKPPLAI